MLRKEAKRRREKKLACDQAMLSRASGREGCRPSTGGFSGKGDEVRP
jgi:hypothetical protein